MNAVLTPEALDQKIKKIFGRLAIDKRRLPSSQLHRRNVPAYVAEWVLDDLVKDNDPINDKTRDYIQKWANKFLPLPSDTKIIKNRLLNGETVKVLTPVEVEIILRKSQKQRVAILKLLGLEDVIIRDELVNSYPELLKQGMWGIVELTYTPHGVAITSFNPMQASVNLELFKEKRTYFTLDEWRALLLCSMGYNPWTFEEHEKNYLLCRLLPLVEKNLHVLELAPKGTGKSYLYENISPRVRLVSGGNVSPAVLFVNNATGQWGLLARFAVVVLDEVQTLKFEKPGEIVGGLKGFLANGRLTRGGLYETSSPCSLVLLANIQLDQEQKPIQTPLVKEMPEFLQETAFIDRLRGIIPGWKVRKLSGDSFAQGMGLKSDFFGDALLALREDITANQYASRNLVLKGKKLYKRNEDAVRLLASGLMKLQFPHGEISSEEFEMYCVRPAIEMRQIVWDQLYLLDAEYRQYDEQIGYEVINES